MCCHLQKKTTSNPQSRNKTLTDKQKNQTKTKKSPTTQKTPPLSKKPKPTATKSKQTKTPNLCQGYEITLNSFRVWKNF